MKYVKPATRPEPKLPAPEMAVVDIQSMANKDISKFCAIEHIYQFARSGNFHHADSNVSIPPWGAFHIAYSSMNEQSSPQSQVAYNPILMAPPTDASTVYTVMHRLRDAMAALGQQHAPICFDMGLMTKALEIAWDRPEEFSGIVLMEGGMHLVMSMIAGVGKAPISPRIV